jgi:hypothetical protein
MLIVSWKVNSQEIDKDVKVIKPYSPSLSGANKIHVMPRVKDTFRYDPGYKYEINSTRISTEFSLRPINAAKMVGEPIPKIYKSYLKLGLGNYFTPLFEFYTGNLRSKETNIAFSARHLSSNSKIRLENDQRVPGGFANNHVGLGAKRIFRKSVLEGGIDLKSKTNFFYGYDPDTIIQPFPERDEIKQNHLFAKVNASLYSTHTDSNHLNFKLDIGYDYVREKGGNFANQLNVESMFDKRFDDNVFGLGFDSHYTRPNQEIDSSHTSLVEISPFFAKSSDEWRFKLGFSSAGIFRENENQVRFYPDAFFQFKVINNNLIAYLGVKGKTDVNSYSKIVNENPYILPSLQVKATHEKVNTSFGLKGKYSNKVGFNLSVGYDLIDDHYFFVNDLERELNNRFTVVYDDVEILRFSGEVTYALNEKWDFGGWFSYEDYRMFYEEKPWHVAPFETTFAAKYNLRDKIIVSTRVVGSSARYARPVSSEDDPVKLEGYADIDLHLEYRYTRILSAFVQFTNILGQRVYKWNYYPDRRFGIMAGFSYSL